MAWARRILVAWTVCAASFLFHGVGAFEKLDAAALDGRSALAPRSASGDVVFVAIDAASLTSVGTWPWSRQVHADLLDRLSESGAREVFFDIDFAFPSDPEGDLAFASALDKFGLVYLPTFFQSAEIGTTRADANAPLPLFADRSWPVLVNVVSGDDSLIRSYPYGGDLDGAYVPSAATQLAAVSSTSTATFPINFAIDPVTVPSFSAADILAGALPEDALAGRSIIVGAAALELGDLHAVPVHGVIPGALVHALATETLAGDLVPRPLPFLVPLSALFLMLIALQGRVLYAPVRFIGATSAFIAALEIAAASAFAQLAIAVPSVAITPVLLTFALGCFTLRTARGEWKILRQKAAVENSTRLLSRFFEDSSDAMLILSAEGEVLLSSSAANRLFGVGDDGLARMPTELWKAVCGSLAENRGNPLPEIHSRTLNLKNQVRYLEFIATPSTRLDVEAGRTEMRQVVSMTIRDVTQLKEQEREIALLSNYDSLTGATRRHAFLIHLGLRLEHGTPCALFVLNLKRFKPVNVLMGREIGNAVLRELVERFNRTAIGLSPTARLEGDTFAVFTETDTTQEDAAELAARIKEIASQPYRLGENRAQVGACIGYVITTGDNAETPEEFLRNGERALDAARSARADLPMLYDPVIAQHQLRALRIEKEMDTGLERGEFMVHYQPQHRMADGAVIGAEALLKWNSSALGPVGPADFVEIAESTGFIVKLGEWVLHEAISDATEFPDELSVAINVSSVQIENADLMQQVRTAMETSGLDARRVCLELTETALATSPERLVETMRDISFLGISWALDDFGSGYSSLSMLAGSPVAKVKFDKSFAAAIGKSEKTEALLRSVIAFCNERGLTSLCEGVETFNQLQVLASLGCDEIQGFVFSRPMSKQDFVSYCADPGVTIGWDPGKAPLR